MTHQAGSAKDNVASICRAIPSLDEDAMAWAAERQRTLTKPPGSLGRLEAISIAVAGMQGRRQPCVDSRAVFVLAGDHGVVAQGVSAYPQTVSAQMVANFLAGGAAINALARQTGARTVIADLGLANDVPGDTGGLARMRVADGTADFSVGPAMDEQQMWEAVLAGIRLVNGELHAGLDLAATGEMGIGNTTSATAILCAISGLAPAQVAGPGTGLTPQGVSHKAQVIQRALDINQPDPSDAWDVLRKVGGFEIAGLAGVVLACAANRIPVVVDGFISGAAALIAARACPAAHGFLLAGHRSAEPGHDALLDLLGLEPLLDLGMRLGEGTGAALAFSVVAAAVRTLNEMATFGSAGVDDAQ